MEKVSSKKKEKRKKKGKGKGKRKKGKKEKRKKKKEEKKKKKKNSYRTQYSAAIDELLVKLQNQVAQDTAFSDVKDFIEGYLSNVFINLNHYNSASDHTRVSASLERFLTQKIQLKNFCKEIMALTLDKVELDLLRVHYIIVWS